MRRAVYIIIHRRPLPLSSLADSRTGHRRDGDEDDAPPPTTRIVVRGRQRDRRRPRAQNRPSVFWPRMRARWDPAPARARVERDQHGEETLSQGDEEYESRCAPYPPYGRTPGRLARGGAEEEREWRRLRHARRFMRCGLAWTGGRGKGSQRRDGMKGCRGQSGWMETQANE